eukprot:SAG22_NODE_11954_length_462_cov_0.867769_2_plen_37_part_01
MKATTRGGPKMLSLQWSVLSLRAVQEQLLPTIIFERT